MLMTFDNADEWVRSRVNVPTWLGAGELAAAPSFPAAVKTHAFFSARVSSVNILERLRAEVDRFVAGEWDVATARVRMKTFLSRQGVWPDDVADADEPPQGMDEDEWKARKNISNLASTRRLNLILRQQAGMAHAVGNRQVSMHPAVLRRFPYYEYDAHADARPHHRDLDGLVLPKTDPFWATHTPPWDYNCRCAIEDATEEEARAKGVTEVAVRELPDGNQDATVSTGSRVVNIPPNESGYTFRVDAAFAEPDWDAIPDGPLQDVVRRQMESRLQTPAEMPQEDQGNG